MSDTRIVQYIEQLEQLLTPLTPTERQEIVAEVRSHLSECSTSGPDALTRAFGGFRSPGKLCSRLSGRRQSAPGSGLRCTRGFVDELPAPGAASFPGAGRVCNGQSDLSGCGVADPDCGYGNNCAGTDGALDRAGHEPLFPRADRRRGTAGGRDRAAGPGGFFRSPLRSGPVFAVIGLAMSRWIAARLIRRG